MIAKVIVYKLDRISRSILDFANMMELFQQYDVDFVSSTKKFDTSTPMGRAMLNICIVFAQLERETIQKRVADAYYSRSLKGFRMGSKAPYGFRTEPIQIDGIYTKKLVANPEEAEQVKLMLKCTPSRELPTPILSGILQSMVSRTSPVRRLQVFYAILFMFKPIWMFMSFSKAKERQSSMMPLTLRG